MTSNPWEDLNLSSRRRAVVDDEIFWVKNRDGYYGVYLEFTIEKDKSSNNLKLHNIEIHKQYNEDKKIVQWYLLLKNQDQWQIFKVLCHDLIHATSLAKEAHGKILLIENRLKLWKELLKKDSELTLPVEVQMGIFSELTFLKDIMMQRVPLDEALKSWYGPEFDKQDFILENSSFEIKSYRSSNGEKVYISSKEQLDSYKKYAYLIAYGLTVIEGQGNIYLLAKEIEEILTKLKHGDLIDLFYMKLFQAGYSSKLYSEESLKNFKVDRVSYYEVEEDFPKITSAIVSPQIVSLSYQIDLSQCSKWNREMSNLVFKEGPQCTQ